NGPECQYHVVIPDLRTGIPYAVIGRTFGNKQLPVLCLSAFPVRRSNHPAGYLISRISAQALPQHWTVVSM
ncbi:hypothetical protein ACUOCP_52445, partial [Escherichia sp. R-CC3]